MKLQEVLDARADEALRLRLQTASNAFLKALGISAYSPSGVVPQDQTHAWAVESARGTQLPPNQRQWRMEQVMEILESNAFVLLRDDNRKKALEDFMAKVEAVGEVLNGTH